jgi:phosphatidylserine/phosphatidylglycerophosphate/cardiolipin synthase-like enzyme
MNNDHLSAWHDTALVLQGEAAALVEREFDRRWTKVTGAPPAPKGDSWAKLAVWEMDRDARLDEWDVAEGSTRPTPFANRSLRTPAVPVNVLVTNGETPRLTQIRDGLVAAIANARTYAYFENCAFYDASLVRALAQKYAQPSSTFQTIALIPQPVARPDGTQAAYFALSKAAWSALLVAMGTWEAVTVPLGVVTGKTTVQRSECSRWWLEWDERISHTALQVMFDDEPPAYRIPVTQLLDVRTSETRATLCGPARCFATPPRTDQNALPAWPPNYRYLYVHSKLALFDDATAFVGSANFTERSMLIDGELSVSVSDGPTVVGIREALFGHWGMGTPGEWRQRMAAFERTIANGVGVLPLPVGRLGAIEDLPWTTWAMTGLTNV